MARYHRKTRVSDSNLSQVVVLYYESLIVFLDTVIGGYMCFTVLTFLFVSLAIADFNVSNLIFNLRSVIEDKNKIKNDVP